ncbi:aspartate dehydrogenase domain-containing protein [Arthrobacter sp. NPDC058127]|uniref:aspartate dehydrogenase domain-containing protein n=1 Tax=Arthrobacter sp. NPDC058127 TaxID=3346351 RepID=UPI0036E65C30
MKSTPAYRVGIIGYGAIGVPVVAGISAGQVAGAVLEGVISRSPLTNVPVKQLDLAEALERCDLLVECAGQEALVEHAEDVLRASVDLLVTSIGALADREFAERLHAAGPGRLFLTSGAVGGLDLLSSGARADGYDKVTITTTKLPGSLVQPWMNEALVEEIRNACGPLDVYEGSAAEAAMLFPKSLNAGAAVAIAVNNWDAVTVRVRADPAAELTSHVIEASGNIGEYRFEIRNKPSEDNPKTSGVVPFAVLRSLESIIGGRGGLI